MADKLYDILKHSGLTKNESKVYLTLIKLGSIKAGKLAKETEFNRTTTYECLRSLGKKGLVSYVIIGKIKYFQASNPKNLELYLQDKLDAVKNIIPDLENIYNTRKLKENVRLFKGNKGIKTVLDDILQNAKENRVFGSEGQLEDQMPYYAKRFVALQLKNKLKIRSILRHGREPTKRKYYNVKYIDLSEESPVVTNVYNNKIAIFIWSEAPEVILIENEKAANIYKEYFDFIWEHAKKE